MLSDTKWVPDIKMCEQIVNSFKKILENKNLEEGTKV
jgi:hypothetical protein